MSRISLKLRRQILQAIGETAYDVLKTQCPFSDESGPDDWCPEETRLWDILNAQADDITRAVTKVLDNA